MRKGKSMKSSTKNMIQILIAILLEFTILVGIVMFQQTIMMAFPLPVRAVLMIVIQWTLLIVPVLFMLKNKENLSHIGFSKRNILGQVIIGILVAIIMSSILTILPILVGLKDMVGSTTYTKAWQFAYQFLYMILGVAFVEEIFYRGFLFKRLLDINGSKWFAIIISSIIFGLSHIMNGNIIQVIATSLLGVVFCLCREKIKHCTTLSLILIHGIHNACITLFVAIL